MNLRRHHPHAVKHRDRSAGRLLARRERPGEMEQRQHLLRSFSRTAVLAPLLGVGFLLTSDHGLHSMAIFLFAWSGGWSLASLALQIKRRVNDGRRSDER